MLPDWWCPVSSVPFGSRIIFSGLLNQTRFHWCRMPYHFGRTPILYCFSWNFTCALLDWVSPDRQNDNCGRECLSILRAGRQKSWITHNSAQCWLLLTVRTNMSKIYNSDTYCQQWAKLWVIHDFCRPVRRIALDFRDQFSLSECN